MDPQIAGLTLISKPNAVLFTTREELFNGVPEIKIPGNGVGAQYFVLKSFSFGCGTAAGQSVIELPTRCKIKVTLSRKGKVVGSAQASFIFDITQFAPTLQKFNIDSSFGKIDSIRFEIVEPEVTEAVTVALIDDIHLEVYK